MGKQADQTDSTPVVIEWSTVVTARYRYRTTVADVQAVLTAMGIDGEVHLNSDGTVDLDSLQCRNLAWPSAWDEVIAGVNDGDATEVDVDTDRKITSVTI